MSQTNGSSTLCRSVLLVEDEPAQIAVLRTYFERAGWTVHEASTGAQALHRYTNIQPDVVLLDLNLPDLSGLAVLKRLRESDPEVAVVMVTGSSDIESAVEALQCGAENFLVKPYVLPHLGAAVERAHEKVILRKQARWLWEHQSAAHGLGALGGSAGTQEVARQIQTLAQSDTSVLLQGETGTGKGWVAQLLHTLSARTRAPFIEVNCAGLTATFLDSELFGHERGAFTDAKTQKAGLFEVANHGTIFLDEIGDLAPELQPKLLKALENRRFRRIGGTKEVEVDVRLVTATHRDLRAAVRDNRFREDLYYRIAVATVRLPPLRERGRTEIGGLAMRVLTDLARRFGRGTVHLAPDTLDLLARHTWPGNIRELKTVLEQAMLVAGASDSIRPDHLPPELRVRRQAPHIDDDVLLTLDQLERRHIERVLARTRGNRTEAARVLGISRVGLYKKLQRFEAEARGEAGAA